MGIIVITGASEGIGREMAIRYAQLGFSVGLLARRKEMLAATEAACRAVQEKLSPRPAIVSEVLDVTDSARQREILQRWWDTHGGIDGFIANAGLGLNGSDAEDNFELFSRMIRVNLSAAIDGLEFLKPKMVARRSGTLAAITSLASARGMPKTGGYCLTKAALHSYLEALRMDVRKFGVTVCEAAPGYVDTAMTKPNGFHMPFLLPADQAAQKIVARFQKRKAFTVVPWQFRLIYPVLKNAPERLVQWATEDGA